MPNETPETPPRDAHDAVSAGGVLVDCREDWEWRAGHAPQAVHIPMSQVPRRLDEIRDKEVYLTCYSGGRSGQVTRWLRQQGVEAINVRGGMKAWVDQDLPIEGDLVH